MYEADRHIGSEIESRKYAIISQIVQLNNAKVIDEVAEFVRLMAFRLNFEQIFKPIKATISVEEMAKEQNFQGFDANGFSLLVSELDTQEPLEELLACL